MEIQNNNRFSIKRNAYDYLKELGEQDKIKLAIDKINICQPSDFSSKYSGDPDFKKYFSGNFEKIDEIIKYYPDITLFLKNIYWKELFDNAGSILAQIMKTFEGYKDKSLFIVNVNSIEMVIVGEILKSAGFNNLTYNIIRQPTINSYAKTFEALLLMLAFEKSEYFQTLAKPLIEIAKISAEGINKDDFYILMDENNGYNAYSFHAINYYLKTQIGLTDDKITYRIDKYPKKDFIEAKKIKNVIILDNDNDAGKSIEYFIDTMKTEMPTMNISKVKYDTKEIKGIGYFEDYLTEKNVEYTSYKANIDKIVENKAKAEKTKKSTGKQKTDAYIYRKSAAQLTENNLKLLPFLILFPILTIAFLVSDNNGGSYSSGSYGTGSRSTYHSNTYFFGNFGSIGSSIGSSSSSSSSKGGLIKSFGGGGFSKGFS